MTPIYSGTKVVGKVDQNVFIKRVQGTKHFLRKPPGIAISVDAVDAAKRAGATAIKVTDTEARRDYWCSMDVFYRYGARFSRGFGPQIVLAFDRWTASLALATQSQPVQASLI